MLSDSANFDVETADKLLDKIIDDVYESGYEDAWCDIGESDHVPSEPLFNEGYD